MFLTANSVTVLARQRARKATLQPVADFSVRSAARLRRWGWLSESAASGTNPGLEEGRLGEPAPPRHKDKPVSLGVQGIT